MKNITKQLITVSSLAFILVGCAGQQVSTNPTTGVTTTNYVPNVAATQLAASAQTAAPVIGAAVPQPYGAMAGLAVGLLGLLVGGIASAVAVKKNAQANLHQSTLQSVVTGIESAVPAVQQALTVTAQSGVVAPATVNSLNTANAVLSAVKGSIQSATVASGTATNLNTVLASAGVGPTAS